MPSRILFKPLGTLAAVRSSRFQLSSSSGRPPRGGSSSRARHRDDVRGMRTRRRQRDVFRQSPKILVNARHFRASFVRSVTASSRRSRGVDSILNSTKNEFYDWRRRRRRRRDRSLSRALFVFDVSTIHGRVKTPIRGARTDPRAFASRFIANRVRNPIICLSTHRMRKQS